MVPIKKRPASLRLFQALAIAIDRRDTTVLGQGLRVLTDLCDDIEGEQILRLLVDSLSPQDRYWFGNLNGVRKPRFDAGKIQPMIMASDVTIAIPS